MLTYRALPTSASCPNVDWFESLPLPQGRTFKCIGREKVALDSVIRVNEAGQVVNLARALGTNKENARDLANAIKVKGVLLDAQPPYMGLNHRLYDGFTRFEAIDSLGFEYWVFNIVEPKEGFTWNDVWDEIGLGANDHPPSKPASRDDFKKRLGRWIKSQEKTPTQGQCIDWINNIPHSFTNTVVSKIAEDCLSKILADATMENMEPKDVLSKFRSEVGLTNRVEVIPINLSGNNDYIKRAVFKALEEISDPKKDMIRGVGYLKDVPAEQAEEKRKAGIELINNYNELFEAAFQKRMKSGAKFRLIDVDYICPQIIDEETKFRKLDSKR